MMDFSQFYQQGGPFMHFISLVAIAVAVSLARRVLAARRTLNDPEAALHLQPNVTPWLIACGIMIGLLGSCMGLMEVSAALRTISPDQWTNAALRGAPIAMFATQWALITLTPATLAHAVLRHFEHRVDTTLTLRRVASARGCASPR